MSSSSKISQTQILFFKFSEKKEKIMPSVENYFKCYANLTSCLTRYFYMNIFCGLILKA